jgi:hypothetical protein
MRCKCCKDKFIPKKFLQKYCMEKDECIKAFYTTFKETEKKKQRKETRKEKEALKTKQDYAKELQVIFNTFIRTRDKGKPCISCGCIMDGKKGDASHFYSVGGNPSVRFNEDNVHLSCVYCNRDKHGNLLEYNERLPDRIGLDRYKALKETRNTPRHYTIPELIELKVIYKDKIKELK